MKRIKQVIKTFEEWFAIVLLPFLIILLIFLVVIFLSVMFGDGAVWIDLLGRDDKGGVLYLIGIAIGGVFLAILRVAMSYRRVKAIEDTAQVQAKANQNTEQGQRQERLKNAIEHLGHERSSVRLGGAYELFHLAEDTKTLRQTILEILCAHIRRTTRNEDYQKEYGKEPSEEIQSLLTLLFVQKHDVFGKHRANLQGSRLNGASFSKARLQKADLRNAQLQGATLRETQLEGTALRRARLQEADLSEAQLREADLSETQMQKANLFGARLQEATLSYAQLQGAVLNHAQLQGAKLRNTQLQGARLLRAHLQGAVLWDAQMQGAYLSEAQLQGADLSEAQLQGADLSEAQLQGADLSEAQLQGADLSEAQLQGAFSSYDESQWDSFLDFVTRIRHRIDQKSDFSTVVFSGGLSEDEVNDMTKEMLDSESEDLKEKLKPHIGQPASHELPADSGAHTDPYTQEDAEQWIKEYEEAFNRDDVRS